MYFTLIDRYDGSKPGDLFIITNIKGLLAGVRTLVKDVDQWGLCQVYLKSLQILSTAAWSAYPYHIGTIFLALVDVIMINVICVQFYIVLNITKANIFKL